MLKFRTVRQGERVALWNKKGQVEIVDGPKRLFLYDQITEKLARYAAGNDEYLAVTYKDGHREHIRGPKDIWFNPVAHQEIKIQKAFAIDANEAIVVYQREAEQVSRRVLRGPQLYVPGADEWLHQFCWHGADPKDHRRKIPGALVFNKLRVIPDQMYFDVWDVRTADDALLVLKLMVFFELTDINRMLDQTHDPIADFINAITADVIDFAATLTFEGFKEKTEKLNELETYPQLVQRGERIGYKINKVVYRGYHANDALQTMHDHAIETRTRLRLEAETENQAQELADMKLDRELGRAMQRQQMEEDELRHRNHLLAMEHEERMRQKEAEQQNETNARRMINEIEQEHLKAQNDEQTAFLHAMQEMKIDLTRYLVAQYQNPDRLIRIEEGRGAQLHLHE